MLRARGRCRGRGRGRGRISIFILLLCLPAPALAEPVRIRVADVITATSDVHDSAVMGDDVLLATSGGLVIRRGGAVVLTLTSRDGLPGTRLRSVNVTGSDEAWAGSIEGVARISFHDGGAEVTGSFPLPRVRRVVRFAGAAWFATYGDGLYRLDDGASGAPVRVRFGSHPTHDHLTDIAASGSDLYVATAGAGVFRLGPDGRQRGRLRTDRGLADDLVWRLVPDGARVLAATAGGVSVIRDGQVVRNAREARAAASLPVRDVRALLLLNDGLWIATFGGGLFRLGPDASEAERIIAASDARGGRLVRTLTPTAAGVLVGHARGAHIVRADGSADEVDLGGLPSGDVTALQRAFGTLWVGTFTHGLARVSDGVASAEDRATSRWGMDRRINDLAMTGSGTPDERLWIATDRGLSWHDGLRFVQVDDPGAPSAAEHVTCLHVQPGTGDLWVGSSRQLSRWSGGRWRSWTGGPSLPIANVHAVTSDRRGDIWVGSLHGLYRFDPDAGTFERHSVASSDLPVDWVTAVVAWEDGIVAGTYHGGLSWFDGRGFSIEREAAGATGPELPSGWVNPHAMTRIGDTLWIGTLERGLVAGRPGAWTRLDIADGLPSRDVTVILPAGDGSAWVGTRGGLVRVTWDSRPE
jgi:ligand-binding sensor domain-containing protein